MNISITQICFEEILREILDVDALPLFGVDMVTCLFLVVIRELTSIDISYLVWTDESRVNKLT